MDDGHTQYFRNIDQHHTKAFYAQKLSWIDYDSESDANRSEKNTPNYVVLKENGEAHTNKWTIKNDDKTDPRKGFENLLYFVCNLCPFLCTKNEKIIEHIENAHKNRIVSKLPQFKCPACVNVFYHKLPLRSHLIHDHGVGNSDLPQIIQGIVYYATEKAKESRCKSNRNPATKPVNDAESKIDNIESNEDSVHVTPIVLEDSTVRPETIKDSNCNEPQDTIKLHSCRFNACKKRFQSEKNLIYHEKCHNNDGNFTCPVCNSDFNLWKTLANHLWITHKIDMELLSCDQCNYKTVSEYKLQKLHKLIHSNIKAYACGTCTKSFKNSRQLRNHRNIHRQTSSPLTIACTVCSKSFNNKRYLQMHIDVVHEKKKPFLCSYCGYKGSSRSSLRTHIRQHTGEKPFTCDVCSYSSSDHNSLRRHKLRHSDQKPYKCIYCPYACIQSTTYKVHVKTKHPGLEADLVFTCEQCQFRTVNKMNYNAHMFNAHNTVVEQNTSTALDAGNNKNSD